MGLIAAAPKQERFLIPADSYPARCFQVIDFGTTRNEKYDKDQRNVRIVWEFPTVTHVFKEEDGEQPSALGRTFALSLAPKSKLRAVLESWRGKPFTDAELEGFDLKNLVGAPALIQVTHYEKDGEKRADATTITKLPSAMPCPAAVNPTTFFSIDDHGFGAVFDSLPEWMQERIKESNEYKAFASGEGL